VIDHNISGTLPDRLYQSSSCISDYDDWQQENLTDWAAIVEKWPPVVSSGIA